MKSSEWAYDNRAPMSSLYRFRQFVLDPAKRTLSRADSPVFLNPRAMDVLIFLAQNPTRLVTKEELLDAVWGDAFVEEGNLTQASQTCAKPSGTTRKTLA
jgi:DNA-binding winged helix-turn-helix (wHTH) protein